MPWFDHDGRPTAVDLTHPVDVLEPDEASPAHDLPDALTLTERIAESYLAGDPAITRIAWRVLLNHEPASIRACARRAGCTAAAISRRAAILAEQFGMPLRRPQIRALRRWLTRESWKTRRRRDTCPAAACDDDQTKTNTHQAESKGRRP